MHCNWRKNNIKQIRLKSEEGEIELWVLTYGDRIKSAFIKKAEDY